MLWTFTGHGQRYSSKGASGRPLWLQMLDPRGPNTLLQDTARDTIAPVTRSARPVPFAAP